MQLDPNNPEILTALAMALRKSGDAEQAGAVFHESREASKQISSKSEATLQTNRVSIF